MSGKCIEEEEVEQTEQKARSSPPAWKVLVCTDLHPQRNHIQAEDAQTFPGQALAEGGRFAPLQLCGHTVCGQTLPKASGELQQPRARQETSALVAPPPPLGKPSATPGSPALPCRGLRQLVLSNKMHPERVGLQRALGGLRDGSAPGERAADTLQHPAGSGREDASVGLGKRSS